MNIQQKKREVVDRCQYFYKNLQTGEMDFPNSVEGDILKIAYNALIEEKENTNVVRVQ